MNTDLLLLVIQRAIFYYDIWRNINQYPIFSRTPIQTIHTYTWNISNAPYTFEKSWLKKWIIFSLHKQKYLITFNYAKCTISEYNKRRVVNNCSSYHSSDVNDTVEMY